ncbi:MAG: cytochrome P450 [Microcoleaceae cyanobacterium]
MQVLDGPKTPRALRMIKFITRPLDYLEDYQKRYGDIFQVGETPALVYVGHPEGIQQLFNAPPEQFYTGGGGGILLKLLGENSVLLLDGDRHQRQRKLLMPPFHGDRLRTYSQLICQVSEQVFSQLPENQPFRLRPPLQEITLRVILKAVFGLNEGDRYERLQYLLSELLETFGSPLSAVMIFFPQLQRDWGEWSPWGRFVRLKQQVDDLIYSEIRDRQKQQNLSGDDILTLLMSARDEAGVAMSEVELHDELITLLVAGHETTASALSWALYWIHYLPEVEEKLRYELSQLGDKFIPEEIAKLPYLTAICQETLRIYPITLMTGVRLLKSPFELMGHTLPAKTAIFPSIYLLHQRPELYPEPKQFKPERFLERQFSPYEYLPFGGGHRRCIGSAMALLEMKLVLATLLLNGQFKLPRRRLVKPVRRGLTMAPPASLSLIKNS